MADAFPRLFSEFRLAGRRLRNRVAMAPMTRQMAEQDGTPTRAMRDYYARRARGGVALVVTEGVYFSDKTNSKGYPDQPGLCTRRHADAWREITAAIRAEDACCILQLQHAGRLADPASLVPGTAPVSASDTHAPGHVIFTDSWEEKVLRGWDFDPPFRPYAPARELTVDELEMLADEFAAGAERAIEAGFDGVEVHGANGFLIDNFFNPRVNRRIDDYGGSPARRAAFAQLCCARVRAAIGPDPIVTLRVSQDRIDGRDDRYPGGVEEAREIGATLASAPVDAIHWASYDWADNRDPTSDDVLPRVIRDASRKPVIVNGRVHEPDVAEQILAREVGDLVAVGRPLLANPDWPRRARQGQTGGWIPFERRWVIEPAS